MKSAIGAFEVKLVPQEAGNPGGAAVPGRMTIDKKFSGDLDAHSKGQMLAAMTEIKGSAGYVAMEVVTGTLEGRSGSFVLQHSGTMNRGEKSLTINVVPDSGSGGLKGISGHMHIVVEAGKHDYELHYSLPDA